MPPYASLSARRRACRASCQDDSARRPRRNVRRPFWPAFPRRAGRFPTETGEHDEDQSSVATTAIQQRSASPDHGTRPRSHGKHICRSIPSRTATDPHALGGRSHDETCVPRSAPRGGGDEAIRRGQSNLSAPLDASFSFSKGSWRAHPSARASLRKSWGRLRRFRSRSGDSGWGGVRAVCRYREHGAMRDQRIAQRLTLRSSTGPHYRNMPDRTWRVPRQRAREHEAPAVEPTG